MEKTQIVILYASFGGGHKSTANSIKSILEKDPKIEVHILDYFEYFNKLINHVSIKFYNNVASMPDIIFKKMYESTDVNEHFSNFITDLLKLTGIKLIKYFNKFNPDIVISTHPFATIACSYLKKKNKFNFMLANILTDFEIHKFWFISHKYIDLFFVSSEEMKQALINQGIYNKCIHVTGIPIREGFSKIYNKSTVYDKLRLNKDLPTITFFCGGGQGIISKDLFTFIDIAIKNLNNYNLILISGKNQKTYNRLIHMLDQYDNKNVCLFSFLENIPEVMSISKYIISKPGGLTTSESLAAGVPMLIILPLPGQEIANIKYLEKHKAGLYLKDIYEAETIFKKINNNEDHFLKDFSNNAKKISHPFATQNIIKIILENYRSNDIKK